MKTVWPVFEVFEGAESDIPKGYHRIRCHIIQDIKLGENFRRKAQYVAGGHTTNTPSSLTYSSVVSRYLVRIALKVSALNDLDIPACDIKGDYLTSECRERIYTISGAEFGREEGVIMIVNMDLYGLKSSGAAFRAKFSRVLYGLNYQTTKDDPDVWLRAGTKTDDTEYC